MALVSSKEILMKAQQEGYAVGAFNAENMEMVQAIVAAAEELSSPVIIQTTPGSLQYADTDMFFGMVNAEAKKAKVPVALHLDHGNSAELCAKAIFSENVALTKKVVEFAHAMGVPVEGELGTVGGKEDTHEVKDSEKSYTDPEEAKEFAEQTGVDFLAVGIGNAHGFYKGVPKLRFDILEKTQSLVSIPIVLHGASGIPDEDVKKSTGLGICKVNFATELRDAFTKGVKEYLEKNPEVFDPKKYNGAGREKVKELIKHKMHVLNSVHKA